MTEIEFLEAVPLYRSAWIRKVRNRLTSRSVVGAGEAAEDIVMKAVSELSENGRYESIQGPSDITKRIEYRLRDYLDHAHPRAEALLNIEEGDDREAHRFRRGKATIGWVMGGTEEYQRQIDIKDALADLPRRERYVAQMVFVEGQTQAEVASRLGIRQQSVDYLLGRAKDKLKAALADYGGR